MPHVNSRDNHTSHTDPSPQPPFIPGSIDLDIGDDDTDIDTLLQQVKHDPEPRKVERRAKPTDPTQPRTTRPDFWIRRNDDGA